MSSPYGPGGVPTADPKTLFKIRLSNVTGCVPKSYYHNLDCGHMVYTLHPSGPHPCGPSCAKGGQGVRIACWTCDVEAEMAWLMLMNDVDKKELVEWQIEEMARKTVRERWEVAESENAAVPSELWGLVDVAKEMRETVLPTVRWLEEKKREYAEKRSRERREQQY
ncbi:hypothetical protein BU26DRAFT_340400 [Trematosphaeria pertusa]|uniref:Uncharacterized protein n=1 Tax=Trematosphaeria pertusa TaxID=390896 RepID=A0A6A6IAT5_9PLEO|nr:uncharacterized protein BU26DRAFT_340400 [Trematosphaeria pertusa]KAF2247032.1 hypothetical protein BU26DRAFT_340400 [Trematosphaeria pertusa]